jgi:hypothetical protein
MFTDGGKETGARLERILLVAGLFPLVVASLIWIERDHTVWPWDQAWYGQATLDLWDASGRGPIAWIQAMIAALGSQPPLLPWLSQVFIPLSPLYQGRIEPALLLLNVLCQGAGLILIFRLARRIGCGEVEALTGALIAFGGSLVVGLADQFLVETLLCTICVLTMWVAWRAAEATRLLFVASLTLTTALGFLTKPSAFTFIIPYLAYAVVARIATRVKMRQGGRHVWLVAALACISAAACLAWYVMNWALMRQHFIDATFNEIALLYGSAQPFSSKLRYWAQSAAVGLSPWPWLAPVVMLLILGGLASRIPHFLSLQASVALTEAIRSGWLFAGASAGLVVVMLCGLSYQIGEDPRFVVTVYAPLGIATAWALTTLGQCWLSTLAAGLFALNTLWNIGISHGLFNSAGPYLKPYDPDKRDMARLSRVVADTCPPNHDPRYRVIGVSYPSFNANSAAFYAAIQRWNRGLACSYTDLGFEKDVERAIARLDQLPAQEVIFIAPAKQPAANFANAPGFANAVSFALAESLRSNSSFELKVSDDGEVWIFVRRSEDPAASRKKP